MPFFGENFYANTEGNSALRAAWAKPKISVGITGKRLMELKTETLLQALKDSGLEISLKTLQRYQKQKLIPAPIIRSEGPGKRFSEWPEDTPFHVMTTNKLINNLNWPVKKVAETKRIAEESTSTILDLGDIIQADNTISRPAIIGDLHTLRIEYLNAQHGLSGVPVIPAKYARIVIEQAGTDAAFWEGKMLTVFGFIEATSEGNNQVVFRYKVFKRQSDGFNQIIDEKI